jgi:hypothetical protein
LFYLKLKIYELKKNSKLLFGILWLCFSEILVAQTEDCINPTYWSNILNINLNFDAKEIKIIGFDCDPCTYDAKNYFACKCIEKCNSLTQPEIILLPEYLECAEKCVVTGTIWDCYNDCDNVPSTDKEWLACRGRCRTKFICLSNCISAVKSNCIKNCGPLGAKKTNPIGYGYKIDIWYSTDIVANGSGDADEKFISEAIKGRPETIKYNLTKLKPDTKTICYKIRIAIKYEDNSCCIFDEIRCYYN